MKKIPIIIIVFFSLLFIRNSSIVNAVSPTPVLGKPPAPQALCQYVKNNQGNWEFMTWWLMSTYQDGIIDYQLQVFDQATNTWYANQWIGGPITMGNSFRVYNIPADRLISGRFRSTTDYTNLSPWSDTSTITCSSSQPTPTQQPTPTRSPTYTPTPTLTPSLTPTPTITPTLWPTIALSRPQAPTGTCGPYNPETGFFSINWRWSSQPSAWNYYFFAFDKATGPAFVYRETPNTSMVTDRILPNVKIRAQYTWRSSDHRSESPPSQAAEVTCIVPTATPTPTPTRIPMVDLKIDSATIINGEPEVVVSNIGEYSAIFVNFPSVKVAIHCRDTNNQYIRNCSQQYLRYFQRELSPAQSMTVRLPSLSANMVSFQANVEPDNLVERTLANNSLPMMRIPIPTATPTPTTSPLPDLTIESLSFDAKTRAPTMKIKNNERATRAVFANARGGYVTAQFIWRDSGGGEVSKTKLNIPPDTVLESGETMTLTAFGQPPYSAVTYWATVNRPEVLEESNGGNNTKFGDLPVLTPTPTLTPVLPTATTVPTNTPMPNITSPTPTPVDKKQSVIDNLSYPIAELGSCKDKADCQKYCDMPENVSACNEYAVKNGFMAREEAERIRNATQVKSGPGGCNSQENCASYCDKPENLNVCLDYAEKNNLMSADELSKSKKVLSILSSGSQTPGECKTPKQCQSYCSDSSRSAECISFARGAGLISEEEAKEAQKVAPFLQNGGPGGCKSKTECDAYCNTHKDECDAFMERAGIEPPNIEGKPKKTGGGAVCTTVEECKTFCQNPANAEACKNVVIKEFQTSGPTIQGDIGKLLQNVNQMPQESKDCLRQALGAEVFRKLMAGEMLTTPISGDVMQSCFAKGVEEYEKKMQPTKKPDDWDMVSTPSGNTQISPSPSSSSEVEGTSTQRTILEMIIDWFRK
ncbi:MAG: hypothetical protein HYW86_05030 [Candidatus Roizmanbacteria bacterium]|nr:MAG: hypothetical protein HYW86_05030 [Candidatus Roizmanbacteria bacterium]